MQAVNVGDFRLLEDFYEELVALQAGSRTSRGWITQTTQCPNHSLTARNKSVFRQNRKGELAKLGEEMNGGSWMPPGQALALPAGDSGK